MTTTVKRGAGRPAATAKSNRHAQRTALPPRPGTVAAAREEIGLEDMSVPALRTYAGELGISPVPGTRSRILEAIRALDSAGPKAKSTPKPVLAPTARTAVRKSGTAASDAPVRQLKVTGAPQKVKPATKSDEKAFAYIAKIEQLGWDTSVERHPEHGVVEVTAKRGEETLWISWTHGAMTNVPKPSYTFADRTVQIRNASECLRYAARQPEEADEELTKVRSNRFFRRRPVEPKKSRLPFDPETATDLDLLAALDGTTVHWHNSISQETEVATVMPGSIEIVKSSKDGQRIIKFLCRSTGFRAFRLSSLTKVGGGARAARQPASARASSKARKPKKAA